MNYDPSGPGKHRLPPMPPPPPLPPVAMPRVEVAPVSQIPPPPPESGLRMLVLGVALGAMAAGVLGFGIGLKAGDGSASTASASIVSASPTPRFTPIPAPSPTPSASSTRQPTKADVRLEVEETRRQCYEVAGCNVSYTLDVIVKDKALFDPDTTYAITYRVKGAPSPILGTITLVDGRTPIVDESTMGVRVGGKLTAIVTKLQAR